MAEPKNPQNLGKTEKIGQEQFQDFVFGDGLSWQEIIYDLINSEQLDPWDIDLVLLAQRYLERIRELEEANFMVSSKVLVVCTLLLRIKSEVLINRYIKDLDDVLFNNKKQEEEKIEFSPDMDEDIPLLLPRTPLPRFRKISIQELMSALNKAMETETRRTVRKEREKEIYERAQLFMPKKGPGLAQRIKEVHERVKAIFQKQEKVSFTEFAGLEKDKRIYHFIPLLHLDTQSKLWLDQERYLEEIWILKQRLRKFEDELDEGNEIVTDNIERKFEDLLDKDKLNELKEEGWETEEDEEPEKIETK
ncbi:MAG: segregation/condensation protein A [Candidatus Pacearchaeota archaeon]|jgi:segregation and condensation protein A